MLEVTEPGYISQDVRYMTFATGSRDSQEILTKSFFEKEIKNIESLSKPSIVAKIWKEIDKVAMKKSGRVIEQVCLPYCYMLTMSADDLSNSDHRLCPNRSKMASACLCRT